ncbi:MAG: bifunctional diaminohydroxyphosphoribosylaminopyrimidine deaminase/5-amino-6-(5-phosphoribosylamino)uracil reductase RibD [Gammaproteobacteria bacterium]|nr:bifunctional diaminohydroxyphosphoribosylaminopyrimidine deaminase/5-amino-6-(5-phosphoribosylamino)uracil reductase RibD [Gammaproteobacteria bacterium]
MARALKLARCGLYTTRPNPRVGCVIVKDGAVVGEGFHYRAGEAHAEVEALRAAGNAAAGATVYVTLEPCTHFGRTPPCTEALIAAHVARVVYAIADPHVPAGGGAAKLAAAGITVECGPLSVEARALNRGFFLRGERARPFVTIKIGMSLDARIALADGQSQWITSPESRADVQRLRAAAGAIVTGSGTVLADDPTLNVRDPRFDVAGRPPPRVVIDRRLRTPPSARLFDVSGEVRIFTANTDDTALRALGGRGAIIEPLGNVGGGDLSAILTRLHELEVNEVLIEAGPTLVGSLLEAGVVDELVLYIAPVFLGPTARAAFLWPALTTLANAPRFRTLESVAIGPDRRLTLAPAAA